MSSILSEAASAVASPRQTAGAWLREARQRHGLHIVALAATLKVHPSKLEALEADRWDELPDTTFVRALAKSICRVLKIDAAPVLVLLPNSEDRELTMSRGLNQPFRDRTTGDLGFSWALLQRPVVWAPVLLFAAAVTVYFMPAAWLPSSASLGAASPAAEAVGALPPAAEAPLAPASQLQLAPSPAQTSASSAAPTTVPSGTAASTVPASGPTPGALVPLAALAKPPAAAPAPAFLPRLQPAAAAPSATPSAAQAMAAPVPPPGSVPLVVKVSAESWVEVVDASGRTLLSKLLRPGDAQNLAGLPPLRVRVGNVSGTELILRGEPVDLLARSKDNVARLELN